MGHVPRKYTDVGKKEARIANDALQAKLAIKELQEQMESLKKQKSKSEPAPAPEPEPAQSEPSQVSPEIEYSPEIQQAKERAANYKNEAMSENISDDIYKFDDAKDDKPRQATQSFLDNEEYQFIAQ